MTVYLSPFQRHRQATATLNASQTTLCDSKQSVHLLSPELARDIEHMRQTRQTRADRQEYKRTVLLPKWQPLAEHYLKSGKTYPNLIFVYCIIWLFDVGEMDKAIEWGMIATEQNQPTPANFKSGLPALIADNVLAWAEQTACARHSIEPYFSQVFERICTQWRLHEEICAKWYKFAGGQLLRGPDGKPSATATEDIKILEQAKALLTKAQDFYPAIGVKTLLSSIEARQRALTANA